ncbi:hypothetical protein BO82DRAFT_356608 [Aspergillus uvarum CBS 121591]|uniref:Uncharacterized protein n=1 Tax=Aspergillus uvarum CBS 121591 TaxID=1448315 RepID=A0A319C2B7_9EURO|nr:hypothetical protein BO82DRAFT_356608 [Aspergillus uvarum CBS 121591]PYH79235.1 hypothetical protein BO82DRAFT_356608 [Aspergillus uvarum CBS 121591]
MPWLMYSMIILTPLLCIPALLVAAAERNNISVGWTSHLSFGAAKRGCDLRVEKGSKSLV